MLDAGLEDERGLHRLGHSCTEPVAILMSLVRSHGGGHCDETHGHMIVDGVECTQETILASSASILDTAAGDGYWSSGMYTSTLQVLDQVIGAYDTTLGTVVGSDLMGQDAANK